MTLNLKKQSLTYLSITFLVFLLIAAPAAFLIASTFLILYWYRLGGNKKNEQFANSFGATNSTLWLIACGLMFASLAIYHTEAYITQFGFPTTVVTYYDYPASSELASTWRVILSKLAVNPLQGVSNIVMYFLLLKVIKVLRKGR